MSKDEILWRISSLLKALVEHLRVACNCPPAVKFKKNHQEKDDFKADFTVFHGQMENYKKDWMSSLINKADKIINHQISYFNLQDQHLETPINWHKDHATGQQTSRKAILNVDYRDINKNGDCKLVWEPNRHHQLVVLARAYQVSKDLKYAQAVVTQLTSWLDANPYGYGMNWCNPLELGVRLINWVWAIDLISDAQLFRGTFKTRMLEAVFLQCRDIHSKFSQGSSANNHLVGEASGLYIASRYFSQFEQSDLWQKASKEVLETQVVAQSFSDGGSREHAFSYQFFVYQLYFFASQVGEWSGDTFSPVFHDRLKLIALFIANIAEAGEQFPLLGDQDDGYALDLGDHIHNVGALCAIANQLAPDPQLQRNIQQENESSFWIFEKPIASVDNQEKPLQSKAFKESGYFLLQAGEQQQGNQVSLLFDCAQLGYTAIAAHGHADALSFIMRLNGKDLFVDTGTYDYYSFPKWRDHFRKTQAHNTIEVDGLDQSVMTGRFMWEKHAQATCLSWEPDVLGGKISGSHNGYQRLNAPLTHQRDLSLDAQEKQLSITDILNTQGEHDIALYFHLSEDCQQIDIQEHQCSLQLAGQQVVIYFPEGLQLSSITGKENTDPHAASLGWISRGYHQKTAITTLIARGKITQSTEFTTIVNWH